MVQDCSWRPCGDFHCLNLISEADCYPLPNMVDFTSILAGATIFSKLDLKKGYHQIPVYPSDIKKTTIITTFGLFKFLRMPFGLKNASITFQRFKDKCLAGLPFMLVYLENILIASPDRQTHAAHLHQVLEPLQATALSSTMPSNVAEPPLFGWLLLLMAKVPEPTLALAPTYLGQLRLRLQAKRGGSRRLRLQLHTLKFFILSF